MTKQLIIDKSVFQATPTSKLEEFVENHFLILPEVLYYECLTTDKDQNQLLRRFSSVIVAGAYTCPAHGVIIRKEAQTLLPFNFLVDLSNVYKARRKFAKKSKLFSSAEIEDVREDHLSMARMVRESVDSTSLWLRSKPNISKEIRRLNVSKENRLKHWITTVDAEDIHLIAVEKLGDLTNSPDRYCLSEKWVTWHYVRLISVLYLEYIFIQEVSGSVQEKHAEHTCQDTDYVLLLSKADGLLTKDDGCLCLAKAAFPDKDVFSNLDEVPEEYVCHWD